MGSPKCEYKLISLILVNFMVIYKSNCAVERPRGVSISKASFYTPGSEFTCLNGQRTIPFSQINDDYCDCEDGSDEPGTSACPNGSFHCTNAGHKPENIPSSRVNDAICDCCDGTDEYSGIVTCENTCKEMSRSAREAAERLQVLMKQGFEVYQQYTKEGFQARQSWQTKLDELSSKKAELETRRAEAEEAKRAAEEPEREAKDKHRQAWEADKALRDGLQSKEAAVRAFDDLDTNNDNMLTVEEMRAHPEFDIDANAEVTVEEAREYLEDKEAVDFATFSAEVWPNIKEIYRPTEIQHVPRDEVETPDSTDEPPYEELGDEAPPSDDSEQVDDLDDDRYYDDEDEDLDDYDEEIDDEVVGDSGSDEMPDYDDMTKLLIQEADKARAAYTEIDREFGEAEKEINELTKSLSLDLGSEHEFMPLKGQCYEYSDREYTYKLCPFDRASQRSKTGGAEMNLGKWGHWAGPEEDKYSAMKYDNGQGCWNGPNRSVKVLMECGVQNAVLSSAEPNRCEYEFRFSSPAACSSYTPTAAHPDHTEL